jgi:hypothetical protein
MSTFRVAGWRDVSHESDSFREPDSWVAHVTTDRDAPKSNVRASKRSVRGERYGWPPHKPSIAFNEYESLHIVSAIWRITEVIAQIAPAE